jgi:hypothetical protein
VPGPACNTRQQAAAVRSLLDHCMVSLTKDKCLCHCCCYMQMRCRGQD